MSSSVSVVEIPWERCKVVEEAEDGRLVVLTENLVVISKVLEEKFGGNLDAHVVIMSVVGPRGSGKSLLTNILMQYLEDKKWHKNLSKDSLSGFDYYGGNPEGNFRVLEGEKRGIYIAPKIYGLEQCNGMKIVVILHLHEGKEGKDTAAQLIKFLYLVSTTLVAMSSNTNGQESAEVMEELFSSNLQDQVCKSQVKVSRKALNQDNSSSEKMIVLEEMLPAKSKHLKAMEGIFKRLTDATTITATNSSGSKISVGELPAYLEDRMQLLNSMEIKQIPDPVPLAAEAQANKEPSNLVEPVKAMKSNHDEPKTTSPVRKKSLPKLKPISTEPAAPPANCAADFSQTGKSLAKSAEVSALVPNQDLPPTIDFNTVYGNSQVIWELLQDSLERWMENNLSIKTAATIQIPFDSFVDEILKQKCANLKVSHSISTKILTAFTKQAKEIIEKDFRSRIQVIEKAIQSFCKKADTHLKGNQQTDSKTLNKFLNKSIQSIKLSPSVCEEDYSVKSLIDLACAKLCPVYLKLIQDREAESKLQREKVASQLQKFHQSEIQKFLDSDAYIHPANLTAFHVKLAEELEGLWREACTKLGCGVPAALSDQLISDFSEIKKKNFQKITIAQKNVDKLLSKMKSEYEIKMNDFLQENDGGVNESAFEVKHKKILEEVMQQFKSEVGKMLRKGEDKTPHESMLKFLLDYSRDLFHEENDTMRSEAEKKRKQHLDLVQEEPVSKIHNVQESASSLEPMLFQFGLVNYGVGTLTNIDIDTQTKPAILGLTGDNEWIVGKEIEDLQANSDGGLMQNIWQLSTFFPLTPDDPTCKADYETIQLGDETVLVCPEFILGRILKLEKERVEQCLHGSITTVYICVPFWLPSYQRQQVLDAAAIAGFDNSYLFNENSAAAFFMFTSELSAKDRDNNVVVISESSCKVDITIFSYHEGQSKLSMIGHAGNYESDMGIQECRSWFSYIPGVRTIVKFFERTQSEEDMFVSKLASLHTKAKQLADNVRYELTSSKVKILVMCESENWARLLVQVAQKVPGCQGVDQIHSAALHGLKAMFEYKSGAPYDSVSDGMPYYVKISRFDNRESNVLMKKSDSFGRIWKRHLTAKLPATTQAFNVVQENASGKFTVMNVKIPKVIPMISELEVMFERNRMGIISISGMKCKSTGFNDYNPRYPVDTKDYQIIANNISQDRVQRYRNVLNTLKTMSGLAGQLEKGRDSLRAKGKSMLRSISDGNGTIPGDIVKMLVTQQVKQILHIVEQPELTLDDVNANTETLDNIGQKYNLL